MAEKITASDVKIVRISEAHNIQGFKSYEQELVNFLVEDALNNQDHKISVTYLIFLESGELVGYVTLLNDRINLEGDLKDLFRGKGIAYHSLPALKIGRLCVDHRFLRMGIGTLMIAYSVKIAQHIFEEYAGCRFIVLDAKRNPENDQSTFISKSGLRFLNKGDRKS